MVEPQSAIQTTGMSYEGRPVLINEIMEVQIDNTLPAPGRVTGVNPSGVLSYSPPKPKNYVVETQEQIGEDGIREVDYQDLLQVNSEILSCMRRMHMVRVDMQTAERAVIKTRIAYDQKLRREMLKITGSTEKVRQAWAEIQCESEFKDWQVSVQISKELQQVSRDIRTELDALKEISNNIRRQIDIDTRLR